MMDEKMKLLAESITPKWRVQSSINGRGKCIVVPYLDARQVQQRLDEVIGASNWANTYEAESGTASIGIRIGKEFVYKSDVGDDTKVEKVKGKASDAFKRAAVVWGIGRSIYQIGSKVIDFSEKDKKPMTSSGTILYTPEQLSNYMNGLNESVGLLMQIWNNKKDKQSDPEFVKAISELKKWL